MKIQAVDKAATALRELPPPQALDVLGTLDRPKLLALLTYTPEDESVYLLGLYEEAERQAALKEMSVGLIIGCLAGLLTGVAVAIWKGQAWVGAVLGIAMALNFLVATTMGAIVPVLLRKLKYDPASGSTVLVTALTDSCGFLFFLGIASLYLKYLAR